MGIISGSIFLVVLKEADKNIVIDRIKKIKSNALINDSRPIWPMIILKTKKGWTGPKEVKGSFIEGTFRAHQVPIPISRNNPENLNILEEWLKSYRPWELFDENGTIIKEIKELAPKGNRRMGANPVANGGLLLKELKTPNFQNYAVEVPYPGEVMAQDMTELGKYVRDVIKLNEDNRNYEVASSEMMKIPKAIRFYDYYDTYNMDTYNQNRINDIVKIKKYSK